MLLEEVVDVGREMGRQADAVDDSADGPAAAVGRGGAVGSLDTIVPRRRSPQRTPPHCPPAGGMYALDDNSCLKKESRPRAQQAVAHQRDDHRRRLSLRALVGGPPHKNRR